jgi:hypothetical protein
VTTGNPFQAAARQHDCNDPMNPITNCGFETGDFTGWVATDLSSPFYPLSVSTGGVSLWSGFFATAPTEGAVSAINGFDGNGPGVISLAQDVTLPTGWVTLEFDYRGAWDLASFGATLDREFMVAVEPSGGGAPFEVFPILTATAGNIVNDSGALVGTVNLTAYAGQNVRINFQWDIPEDFTGPGQFEIDNVLISAVQPPEPAVPTASWPGLALLAGLIVAAALVFILRR